MYLLVFDTSTLARDRLASAASAAGKRMGAKFATGKLTNVETRAHEGYWCARFDGVDFEPPGPTRRQQAIESMQEDRRRVRRDMEAERRRNPARYETVRPVGESAGVFTGMDAEDLSEEIAAVESAPSFEEGF